MPKVENASAAPSDATAIMTASIIVTRWTALPARKMGSYVLMENAFPAPGDATATVSAQMGAMRWSALHAMGTNVQMENAFLTWHYVTVNIIAQMGVTRWTAQLKTINHQSEKREAAPIDIDLGCSANVPGQ